MLITFLLGLSSGAPLLMTGSTLQAWMTDEKVDLALIGVFSLVGIPYTLKFLWSPVMDRYTPPFLGRRRGWILITQILLALAIAGLSFTKPAESPWLVAVLALCVTFFSASQDIVVDAYRREILKPQEFGIGSSYYVFGYRMGLLISGAFALYLADQIPWNQVYLLLAGVMLLCTVFTIFAPNPPGNIAPPRSLKAAVIEPFIDYFKRRGAIEVLIFLLLYKIGDNMAASMTTPFVLGIGFTKTQYAAIAKTLGLAALIFGGFIGGGLLVKIGLKRSLWIFGIFQAASTALFSVLAKIGPDNTWLTITIVVEQLTAGMGSAAFAAFMLGLTNKKFTATQYALLSSLMGIPRVIISAPTGLLAKHVGWVEFFIICTVVAIPGLLMLLRFNKWHEESPQ